MKDSKLPSVKSQNSIPRLRLKLHLPLSQPIALANLKDEKKALASGLRPPRQRPDEDRRDYLSRLSSQSKPTQIMVIFLGGGLEYSQMDPPF